MNRWESGGRAAYLDRTGTVHPASGYTYDAVGNRTSQLDTGKGTVTRWAASAQASSTYPGTTANGAVGPSDLAGCAGGVGDARAWTAGFDTWTLAAAREEVLELTYAQAERTVGVKIHEVLNTPSVIRVDLVEESGSSHTVYSGGDATACGGWLTVSVPLTDYAVKKVRVHTRAAGGEAIEAVGLVVPAGESYAYNGFQAPDRGKLIRGYQKKRPRGGPQRTDRMNRWESGGRAAYLDRTGTVHALRLSPLPVSSCDVRFPTASYA